MARIINYRSPGGHLLVILGIYLYYIERLINPSDFDVT